MSGFCQPAAVPGAGFQTRSAALCTLLGSCHTFHSQTLVAGLSVLFIRGTLFICCTEREVYVSSATPSPAITGKTQLRPQRQNIHKQTIHHCRNIWGLLTVYWKDNKTSIQKNIYQMLYSNAGNTQCDHVYLCPCLSLYVYRVCLSVH